MPRWFAPAAVLFALCLATGSLASVASLPPRWLTAVWPPTGIALAWLAVSGRRLWPAAFLGSTLAFIVYACGKYAGQSTLLEIILGSLTLSGIHTAQVLFGLGLLQRWLPGSLTLTKPRDIVRFLLIAGPVQALVSALLGPLLPMAFGVWPWDLYGEITFDWWRSETLGGIAFAAIALAFLGEPAAIWRPRRFTVAAPLLIWVIIFVVIYRLGPLHFTAASELARLAIEITGCLVLVLLAALLLVITGQSAAVAEEAQRRARELVGEIAARHRTESALAQSEARLAEAQSIARIGSWEWDPVRDTVVWSDMLYRLLGFEPREVPATFERFIQSVHPDDRELVRQRMQDAETQNRPYEFDFRIVRADGAVRVLHVDALIDRDANGQPILWRGTDQDVTERVQAEQEQRRLDDRLRTTQRWESLGQLAGGVAHDFNNLMSGVLGNATLARELLPADSPLHENLLPIEDAAHHAGSLCQQLLAFAGRGVGNRSAIEMQRLINESVELLRMGVPRSVELRIGTTQDLPIVEGDRSQLKQVLLNLVWNSAEAIGPDGGVIEIRTGSSRGSGCTSHGAGHFCGTLAPGPYLWLEVRDTGCGIPHDVLARMFDPFFTTKDVGRGLGLSAVAGIVRSHGGAVCVTSRLGVGTTIRVYLAALEDEIASRTPPPTINTPREIPFPTRRSVIAELLMQRQDS